jgi:GAF domain-containing protein
VGTKAQRRQAKSFSELARVIRSTHDVGDLLQGVADAIAGARRFRDVFVYDFDALTNELILVGATESPAASHAGTLRVPYGDGVTGWVAASLQSYVVNREPTLDPRFLPYPGIGEERYGAIFSVPIVSSRDELLGCITVWAARGHVLHDSEVALVEQVAAFVAAPLENARLREIEARHSAVQRALTVLGGAQTSSPPSMRTVELATELARDVTRADIAITFVTDQAASDRVFVRFAPTPVAPAANPVPPEVRGVIMDAELAVRHGRISWRQAADRIDVALPRAEWTVVSSPLRVGSDELGLLVCYRSQPARFAPEDATTTTAFANQAALSTHLAIVTEEHAAGSRFNWFLRDLAFGRLTADQLRRRAWELGMNATGTYVFLAAEIAAPSAMTPDASAEQYSARISTLLRELNGMPPATLYAAMRHQTIAAIPWSGLDGPIERLRAPLAAMCERVAAQTGAVVTIGLSRAARGVDELADALAEAKEAMAVGVGLADRGSVFTFDDVGHDVLLSRVSGAISVRDRYALAISRIAEYDRVKGTDLLDTVAAFLHVRSQTAAARQLFIHRNTLNQRLERASELGGLELASPSEWFPLQLALKVHQSRAGAAAERTNRSDFRPVPRTAMELDERNVLAEDA